MARKYRKGGKRPQASKRSRDLKKARIVKAQRKAVLHFISLMKTEEEE